MNWAAQVDNEDMLYEELYDGKNIRGYIKCICGTKIRCYVRKGFDDHLVKVVNFIDDESVQQARKEVEKLCKS